MALGVVVAVGCKPEKPDGTSNPPDDPSAQAEDGGAVASDDGQTAAADSGGDGGGNGEQPKKKCAAQVADTPVPLFGERVLIRPPINVDLQEDNPSMAVAISGSGFVSACDATVDEMRVFVFESDKKKSVQAYVDEFVNVFLAKAGYTNGTQGEKYVDTPTEVHTSLEYPAHNGQPPAAVYLAATRKDNNIFIVFFRTRPDEFAMLKPTFQESAQRLLVVPRG
jgi:hypothetical protein